MDKKRKKISCFTTLSSNDNKTTLGGNLTQHSQVIYIYSQKAKDNTTNDKYRTKHTRRHKDAQRKVDGQANWESTSTYPGGKTKTPLNKNQ